MKFKHLILLLFIGLNNVAFSQDCDPAHGGVEVRNGNFFAAPIVASVPVGGTVYFKFKLFNDGGDLSCEIPVGKMRVRISFPRNADASVVMPYRYNGPATFQTPLFNWTFNTAQKVLEGFNRLPIAVTDIVPSTYPTEDTVYVPVLGVVAGSATSPFNIAALNGVTNNIANDGSIIPLVVLIPTGGVPLTINDIEGTSTNCNATAKWTTSNEINLKRFEVETSTDGVKFANVGTVNAGTLSAANAYQYSWKATGDKIFYRLKIVDKDETFTYSKITPITINCNTVKSVKLFPNPAIVNKQLNINLTGYQATAKGELLSATGQLIKTIVLKNGANSIVVDNVAQGFYTLRITEAGIQTEVIKVNVLR